MLTGLPPRERQDEIARYVALRLEVRIDDLARRFGVSVMTMHRDLEVLAEEGRLQKVRGAARAFERRFVESDARLRRHMRSDAKAALAAVAARYVRPGDIVALDDSTTVAALGPHLAGRHPTAVVTHSFTLLRDLVDQSPEFKVIGLGGVYVPTTDSFLGTGVVQQIGALRADVVFISTTAVVEGALFHPDAEAADVKRALAAMAARRVLVVDSTKFGRNALHHVADLATFDQVVVDAALPAQHRAVLDRLEAEVEYVAVPEPPPAPDLPVPAARPGPADGRPGG